MKAEKIYHFALLVQSQVVSCYYTNICALFKTTFAKSPGNSSTESVLIGYVDHKGEVINCYKPRSKRFKNSVDESSFEIELMQDSSIIEPGILGVNCIK